MAAVAMPVHDESTPSVPRTVSVVAGTRPGVGADDIVALVDALEQQTRRPDQLVLVVDHDDALLEWAADTLADRDSPIPIDVVANLEAIGSAGRRRTGLAWSDGDVVAFLSADARPVDAYWVATLLEDYADPMVAAVGGGATPSWTGGRPTWFPVEFGWTIGCSDPGLPTDTTDVDALFPANISFRREVLDELGRFGFVDDCARLRARFPAARIVFDPDLGVHRRVAADECTFAVFRHRAATVDGVGHDRRYVTRVLPGGVVRGIGDGLRGRPAGFTRAAAIVAGGAAMAAGRARRRAVALRNTRLPGGGRR